jgi:hypothetical protein
VDEDDVGPPEDESPEDPDEEFPPTPGEGLLYALGQLHRLYRAGRLPVSPTVLDVEDVARVVGVAGQLEFVGENRLGCHYHFPTEVLTFNSEDPFPWRLLDDWDWAADQELNSLWLELGD